MRHFIRENARFPAETCACRSEAPEGRRFQSTQAQVELTRTSRVPAERVEALSPVARFVLVFPRPQAQTDEAAPDSRCRNQ